MSKGDTFWLPEVGKVVERKSLGGGYSVLLVKVKERDRGKVAPGYYVVSAHDGIWTVMYGPLFTRREADRAMKAEIG